MFPLYEYKVVKYLGVLGFVAAVIIALVIMFNSGIVGGSRSSGSAEVIDSASAAGSTQADGSGPRTTATTGTRTHIVADGESFYSIARKYNVTIAEISQLNPNVDPQNLRAGTQLSIP